MSEVKKIPVKVPFGRQRIWNVMRARTKSHKRFTINGIADECNAANATVEDYVLRLVKAGFAESIETDAWLSHTYRLIRMPLHAPRLNKDGSPVTVRDGQDRMWRSMKMLGQFSADDLVVSASIPERPVKLETAKSYLRALYRAGYFRIVRKGGPNQQAVYRLKPGRSGAEAPQIMKSKFVYDPNCDDVFPKPIEATEGSS